MLSEKIPAHGYQEDPAAHWFAIGGVVDVFNAEVVTRIQGEAEIKIVPTADGNGYITVFVVFGYVLRTATQHGIISPFAIE